MATQTGSIDLRGANSAKLYVDDEAGEIRSEVSETYATKTEVRRTDTGSGTVVTSDDAANLPPLSLAVHGKSVQDGTPSPSSPVAIESVEPTSGTSISLVLSDGTTTAIPLQGHALRSLPDGTEDVLEVGSEGNVTLTKHTNEIDLSTLTWTYSANGYFEGKYLSPAAATLASQWVVPNALCTSYIPKERFYVINPDLGVDGSFVVFDDIVRVRDSRYTDATAFTAAVSGVKMIYQLATPQTISLGTIDLPSLPSPSFSLHVDALVSPTIDAEWLTEGGGKVIDAVSTRIAALESEVDALQGQVPEREVLYDTSTWTIIRYGRTVMVQVHGATATPSTSTALVTGILADYKPAYNCSATVLTSSGSSTQAARMAVYADTGDVYIVPAGYSSSASWYGTLTYIY